MDFIISPRDSQMSCADCVTYVPTGQFVEPAFIEAARELKNKFVLVAPDKFLAKYLPQLPSCMPSIDRKTFKKVAFMRRMKRGKAKQV